MSKPQPIGLLLPVRSALLLCSIEKSGGKLEDRGMNWEAVYRLIASLRWWQFLIVIVIPLIAALRVRIVNVNRTGIRLTFTDYRPRRPNGRVT